MIAVIEEKGGGGGELSVTHGACKRVLVRLERYARARTRTSAEGVRRRKKKQLHLPKQGRVGCAERRP